MTDVMIDLETWGSVPGCAIRSIGAIAFDVSAAEFGHVHCNVTLASCLDVGLHVDAKTEHWWARQSDEAQLALVRPHPINLRSALAWLSGWIASYGSPEVWSHGASFDVPVLACAYRACGIRAPWDYRRVRDTRTLYALTGFDPKSVPFEGTRHSALDDARHQVRCVRAAFSAIGNVLGGLV